VELFSLHGEDSWKLDTDGLITFFRQADQSSATVGRRQAYTFVAMSGLAGHSDLLNTKKPSNRTKNPSHRMKSKDAKNATGKAESFTSPKKTSPSTGGEPVLRQAVGLTVRIEVNLPASGDQATYDRIFKSIRENLLNG
jgi:hypothetical protein